jgi:hypothetical protein
MSCPCSSFSRITVTLGTTIQLSSRHPHFSILFVLILIKTLKEKKEKRKKKKEESLDNFTQSLKRKGLEVHP